MSTGRTSHERPSRIAKFLFEVPVWMYRARLGFLSFGRVIVIVHRGRKSGKRYESGLEVIDRRNGDLYSFSAWGKSADWYRNIEAGGVEQLWDGSQRSAASFRVVDPDEAFAVLSTYEQDHATAARFLFPRMYPGYDFTDEARRALAEDGVIVAFRPAA
jgi:deazaflavin-dependent oxidoreductase (nitroreductase family)